MWIFWALLSAFTAASRRPFEKVLIGKLHYFTYGFLIQTISLPIITAALLISGKILNPLDLGMTFWISVAIVSIVFYPLNSFLYQVAIKHGELSKVLPLQSLWPVFSLLVAWLTLGEVPTAIASSGVLLTVMGVYALGLKGRRLHHPLQPFREDKSSRAMLAGVLLVTCIAVLDKAAIQASNSLFYSFVSTLGAMSTLFVGMRVTKQRIDTNLRPRLKSLGIVGSLQAITYTTYLLAIAAGPVAYVSALRGSNVLMGSMLGIVFFSEKLTKPKILSFSLIIVGAILLALGA